MIETRTVAADDHEIRGSRARAEATNRDARARGTAVRELRDDKEAVGLRERGDRAGALGRGIGGKGARLTARHADQGDHDELGATELGGHAGRKRRLDGLGGFRRPTAIGADDGRREFLEGEHGRGRKARQHDDGLGADDRQAERLAGLQRDAMHENARLAQARDHPVRDVARTFGGAARQDDEIGLLERLAQRQLQRRLVVWHDAERHRLAAQLLERPPRSRRRCCRTPRPGRIGAPGATISSPVESTATRGRRQTSTQARPTAASMPISREVSSLPRRSTVSPRARSLPAKAISCPGTAGRTTRMAPVASSKSVCSTISTASAPRGIMPPVAITVAVPGTNGQAGRHPRRQHLGIEREDARLGRGRARRVGGAQREAVDVGSIEARHIDRGDDVVSEDPTDGLAERHAFLSERRQLEVAMKAGDRLVPIDHLEKLLLLRRAPDRGRETVRLGASACRTRPSAWLQPWSGMPSARRPEQPDQKLRACRRALARGRNEHEAVRRCRVTQTGRRAIRERDDRARRGRIEAHRHDLRQAEG